MKKIKLPKPKKLPILKKPTAKKAPKFKMPKPPKC